MNRRMKYAIMKISFLGIILSLLTTGAFAENEPDLITFGNNQFALNLYSQIKDLSNVKNSEGNLFFSPYSISTALAMTYTGARGNTAKEMADVLKLPSSQMEQIAAAFGDLQKQLQAEKENSGYQLNVANALWGQKGYPFLSEFIGTNKKYFESGLTELDFAKSEEARSIINTWVEEKTNDKIKDLIPAGTLDSLTRLVLTNAIYFKGDWSTKFIETDTKDSDFHVSNQKTVKVPMMHKVKSFEYAELDNMQLLQIPYKGDELSMLVILPKTIGDMETIESNMNLETLHLNIKQMRKRAVDVYLPKFKMTCGSIDINKILSQMGMKDAFSNAADFSGMNGSKDLFISNVLHKAFVEVNEEGTEAAAATGLAMKLKSEVSVDFDLPPVFRADRPFIFMIRDNATQSILFIGRVCNPNLGEQ